MSLKRLLALCAALLLALGAFDVRAESYVRASSRINFYYQHDGGGRNEKSVWDSLLENRLLALYGHGEIYHDATTDRYLTGRGCCLFSFSHVPPVRVLHHDPPLGSQVPFSDIAETW